MIKNLLSGWFSSRKINATVDSSKPSLLVASLIELEQDRMALLNNENMMKRRFDPVKESLEYLVKDSSLCKIETLQDCNISLNWLNGRFIQVSIQNSCFKLIVGDDKVALTKNFYATDVKLMKDILNVIDKVSEHKLN